MSRDEQRHVCPKCQSGEALWQSVTVSGWVDVDTYLEQAGSPEVDHAWYDLCDNEYGCANCEWRGTESMMIVLGIDDQPLPVIHPNQLRLGEAA